MKMAPSKVENSAQVFILLVEVCALTIQLFTNYTTYKAYTKVIKCPSIVSFGLELEMVNLS
jgi:hypothetical protein